MFSGPQMKLICAPSHMLVLALCSSVMVSSLHVHVQLFSVFPPSPPYDVSSCFSALGLSLCFHVKVNVPT